MTDHSGGLRGIGESIGDALLRRAGRVAARVQERRGLEADVLESDDAYRVVVDAPGATGSDVQVRYVDGGIDVRVDRFRDFHEGFDMRFPGRGLALDGHVDLPSEAVVDAEAATATLTQHGTLEIDIPKREDAPDRTEFETEESADIGDLVETVDRTDVEETGEEDGETTGVEDGEAGTDDESGSE